MKKRILSFIAAASLMTGTLLLLTATAASAHNDGKVFVCKYVGTPGVDERLQTGQNPISVSVNSIGGTVVVGAYFNDAHGRSYVLAFDVGQPDPSVSSCPGYVPPTTTTTSAPTTTTTIQETTTTYATTTTTGATTTTTSESTTTTEPTTTTTVGDTTTSEPGSTTTTTSEPESSTSTTLASTTSSSNNSDNSSTTIASPAPRLVSTGQETGPLVFLGLLLIVIGGLFLAARPRY